MSGQLSWSVCAAVALVALTSSCSGGSACSDVSWSSQIVLSTDRTVREFSDTARLRLCQEGACATVQVPVDQSTVQVSLSELGVAIDDTAPVTVTVSTLTPDGDVIARRAQDVGFSAWHPDGPGCGEWGRAEVSVSRDDFVTVPAARLHRAGIGSG